MIHLLRGSIEKCLQSVKTKLLVLRDVLGHFELKTLTHYSDATCFFDGNHKLF